MKPIINLSLALDQLGKESLKVAGFMYVNIYQINGIKKLKRQIKLPKSDIKDIKRR